jgi:hypothetical protein
MTYDHNFNPDIDFFKLAAERKLTPRGSVKPKHAGWKGNNPGKENQARMQRTDFRSYIMVTKPNGKTYRRKLSPKQKLVAEYLLKGFSRRQAMLKAGYTLQHVAKHNTPTYNRTVMTFVESMEEKLRSKGLTEQYVADKFKEWMDAKKVVSAYRTGKSADETTDDFIEIPDFDIQLKAYDRLEKILNSRNNAPKDAPKKREVTFTEWVSGGETTEVKEDIIDLDELPEEQSHV